VQRYNRYLEAASGDKVCSQLLTAAVINLLAVAAEQFSIFRLREGVLLRHALVLIKQVLSTYQLRTVEFNYGQRRLNV
jgi:hypothetical protein